MTGMLVVDDEVGIRRSLKRVLEPAGYRVLLAENGARAIEIIAGAVDAIETVISDYRMPGMDGLATLIAIGKINPEITRIILTGYATMDSAIEAVNAGIDGFITKPFDNNELKAKVKEYGVKKRLKQFVSEQVLAELLREGGQIRPRRQKVAVLFCDVRGFTSLARQMEPEALTELMNRNYFSPLDRIVVSHNGTLDKHIGDSIMAVFGAPVARANYSDQALTCALAMREEMERITRKPGASGLKIGIGISSGEAICGFYGSSLKKEYTVIGEPVNRAARLEKQAAPGQILFCEETWEKVQASYPLRLSPVTVSNGRENIRAYAA